MWLLNVCNATTRAPIHVTSRGRLNFPLETFEYFHTDSEIYLKHPVSERGWGHADTALRKLRLTTPRRFSAYIFGCKRRKVYVHVYVCFKIQSWVKSSTVPYRKPEDTVRAIPDLRRVCEYKCEFPASLLLIDF